MKTPQVPAAPRGDDPPWPKGSFDAAKQAQRAPGPWRVVASAGADSWIDVLDAGNARIARFSRREFAEETVRIRNAHDDLLAALRKADAALTRNGGPQMGVKGLDYKLVEVVRAAIARAEA